MTTPAIDLNSAKMGTTLLAEGVVFRTWAPRAKEVYVIGTFSGGKPTDEGRLEKLADGTWAKFMPGVKVGAEYLFHIVGEGSSGLKRDPYARLLAAEPPFPNCPCLVRDPGSFPWHEGTGWKTPPFRDLIFYQLHVGTFRLHEGSEGGTFLDVARQLPYFASLGITALQLMPIAEFETQYSLGYNCSDYFSPENRYSLPPEKLGGVLEEINGLFATHHQPGYEKEETLHGADNQLRALIDLCHVWGIALFFDVVYNHAGGFDGDETGLFFYDRMPTQDINDSLYFIDKGWAGGLVFAYWNQWVRQFLIDNAVSFYQEYRIDGIRFDEVTVMDEFGGWLTCQNITDALRFVKPEAISIAEYWADKSAVVRPVPEGGAGFDGAWQDELRVAIRGAIEQAAAGSFADVDLNPIAAAMTSATLPNLWRGVNCVENHDIVKTEANTRIARLADPANARSWYARSLARVATGLLILAPGTPMLFMGQEILEDKSWSDNPENNLLPNWAGLESGDRSMVDHLRFTSELIALRRREPALRGDAAQIIHVHNLNRVLAFQRWSEDEGRSVVVVCNLREETWWGYEIGFPEPGKWIETFNSDVYDHWINPQLAGNGSHIEANGVGMHGMPASARLIIPANGFCVFVRG